MKKLEECKEYFKDVFTNCLVENAFEKSIFESTEKAQFEMFCDTLKFIYGNDFKKNKPYWEQEASEEYYSILKA